MDNAENDNNNNNHDNDHDNYLYFFYKLKNNDLNDNEQKVFQMFFEYSESDTPFISRNYISEILGIPLNKIITILNNLMIKGLIIFDPESNKYRYNEK